MSDNTQPHKGFPRIIGLPLLVGAHLFFIVWTAIAAIFVPRYRRLLRFQIKYMGDVLARVRHRDQ